MMGNVEVGIIGGRSLQMSRGEGRGNGDRATGPLAQSSYEEKFGISK